MRFLFICAFVLFSFIELFIIVRFAQQKKPEYLKSTAVSFGLFCLFLLLRAFFRWNISYYCMILVILTIHIHTFWGYYINLYNRSKVFDRYLHGFGSFSFALFFYMVLINLTEAGGSKFFKALLVATIGIMLGVLFEILEFAMDSKKNTSMQRGLQDTDYDLIADVIGSAAAAVFAYFVFL